MTQNRNNIIIELPQTTSRIGSKSIYDGTLKFKNSLSVLGLVKGNIIGGELLVVHPNGKIDGDVFVDYLLVVGEVRGNINAKKGIFLSEKSKVRGSILSAIIRMQSGADFEGECNLKIDEVEDIFSSSRETFYTTVFDKLVHELDEVATKFNKLAKKFD